MDGVDDGHGLEVHAVIGIGVADLLDNVSCATCLDIHVGRL